MWVIIVVLVVLVSAFAAIIAALVMMRSNARKMAGIEPRKVRGEVLGNRHLQAVDYEIDDPHQLGNNRQSIDFHTDDDRYLRLNVTSDDYYRLLPGMYGDITYHGNRLISFKRRPKLEEQRFNERL